jgi:hypothetical protein
MWRQNGLFSQVPGRRRKKNGKNKALDVFERAKTMWKIDPDPEYIRGKKTKLYHF